MTRKALTTLLLRNLLSLAILLFVVNMLACAILFFIRQGKESEGDRWQLPNYANQRDWAREIFRDYKATKTEYQPFIEWKRLPYEGKTTSVNERGERVTPDFFPQENKRLSVHFFGGSAIWGTGADDAHTIPALFGKLAKSCRVTNHAETAFTSRQSLDLLLNLYTRGEKPDLVIFYDGVNDTYHQCARGVSEFPSHARADYLKTAAANGGSIQPWKAFRALFFDHLVDLTKELNKTEAMRNLQGKCFALDCPCASGKPEKIAQSLLITWEIAHDLVVGNGGKFIAVLQPVAFVGNPQTSHLGEGLEQPLGIRASFEVTYAAIQDELKKAGKPWIYDFTPVFDGGEHIYIDFCHVSENGNQLVASELMEALSGEIFPGGKPQPPSEQADFFSSR